MSRGELIKRAKYKTSVKDPGTPGFLTITENKIGFCVTDPKYATTEFEVGFEHIKGHQYTKQGSNNPAWLNLNTNKDATSTRYMFELECYPDLDECHEFLRNLLLEFSCRKVGYKSSMIFDTKPTNKVTFTEEIKHQIFALRPAVHRAYLNSVVLGKTTEHDFWRKYFNAERVRMYSTKNAVAAEAEATEDEENAVFFKDDELVAREGHRKIRRVDPTLDLVADQGDDHTHLPFHGIFRRGVTDEVVQHNNDEQYCRKRWRTLSQDLNRQGAVVLQGTRALEEANTHCRSKQEYSDDDSSAVQQERLDRIRWMTEIEDLEEPHSVGPLCFNLDVQDYSELANANAGLRTLEDSSSGSSEQKECRVISGEEANSSLMESISEIKRSGLSNATVGLGFNVEEFYKELRKISGIKDQPATDLDIYVSP